MSVQSEEAEIPTPRLARTFAWGELHPRRALTLLCLLFFLPGFFTLPPLDRDESRFAQATKQMVETGDFVEIRFQDEARNKKPVGIYWLQALPASLLSGPEHNRIWAYRLPSLLAGILAVLLTHAIGSTLFDRRTGLIAGALLASSTLLVVESGIAKTDAALLAATLLGMWSLARLYIGKAKDPAANAPPLVAYSFWIALGCGVLIKGPVIFMTLGLTLLTLGIWDRSLAWAKALRPLRGLLITLAITLPWFVAIYHATDGAFYAEALGKDFGGKLASGQESHGAPPGLYLVLVWLTFWPASLLLIPAALWALRERARAPARFLIAWALPTWIVIELIPTKLPHYPLPIYPALALIIAGALAATLSNPATSQTFKSWSAKTGLVLWVLPAGLLVAAISLLPTLYGNGINPFLVVSSAIGTALILGTAVFHLRGHFLRATLAASLTGLFVFAFLFEATMAELGDLKVSSRLQHSLAVNDYHDSEKVGIIGYSEPSFIFLNGTRTQLLGIKDAAAFLEGEGQVLIIDRRHEEALREALASSSIKLEARDTITGLNYSKGRNMALTIYTVTNQQMETTDEHE